MFFSGVRNRRLPYRAEMPDPYTIRLFLYEPGREAVE